MHTLSQKTLWIRQGGSYESLWVLASGFLGKYWPHKFWKLQSSSCFSGSMLMHKKHYGSANTTTVSSRKLIEKKRKYCKRKLDMEQSILIRKAALKKAAPKKAFVIKSPRVNDDALQPWGALARLINHDKPHCTNPVAGSGVTCQLCWSSCGENII